MSSYEKVQYISNKPLPLPDFLPSPKTPDQNVLRFKKDGSPRPPLSQSMPNPASPRPPTLPALSPSPRIYKEEQNDQKHDDSAEYIDHDITAVNNKSIDGICSSNVSDDESKSEHKDYNPREIAIDILSSLDAISENDIESDDLQILRLLFEAYKNNKSSSPAILDAMDKMINKIGYDSIECQIYCHWVMLAVADESLKQKVLQDGLLVSMKHAIQALAKIWENQLQKGLTDECLSTLYNVTESIPEDVVKYFRPKHYKPKDNALDKLIKCSMQYTMHHHTKSLEAGLIKPKQWISLTNKLFGDETNSVRKIFTEESKGEPILDLLECYYRQKLEEGHESLNEQFLTLIELEKTIYRIMRNKDLTSPERVRISSAYYLLLNSIQKEHVNLMENILKDDDACELLAKEVSSNGNFQHSEELKKIWKRLAQKNEKGENTSIICINDESRACILSDLARAMMISPKAQRLIYQIETYQLPEKYSKYAKNYRKTLSFKIIVKTVDRLNPFAHTEIAECSDKLNHGGSIIRISKFLTESSILCHGTEFRHVMNPRWNSVIHELIHGYRTLAGIRSERNAKLPKLADIYNENADDNAVREVIKFNWSKGKDNHVSLEELLTIQGGQSIRGDHPIEICENDVRAEGNLPKRQGQYGSELY